MDFSNYGTAITVIPGQQVPGFYVDLFSPRYGTLPAFHKAEGQMPKRKQARRVTMRDMRTILRLTFDQGLSVRAVSDRLKLSKTTVATYLLRAREAGLVCWPHPAGNDDDSVLGRALFQRAGRPPRDSCQPDWA